MTHQLEPSQQSRQPMVARAAYKGNGDDGRRIDNAEI